MRSIVNLIHQKLKNARQGPVEENFYEYASEDGLGTTISAVGDFSAGPKDFAWGPAVGKDARVTRLIVFVADSAINADDYGAVSGASISVGVGAHLESASGTTQAVLTPVPVQSNGEWSALCHDAESRAWGAGNAFLSVRWTFERAGNPIRLIGDDEARIVFTLRDDLDGLVDHRFMLQGYYEK